MGTEVAQTNGGAIMEQVLLKGDLGKLTPGERVQYYNAVCQSTGLNPLTKPFDYITLNGKLTLYALRTCTDQLRAIHGVSVEDLTESERDGVFVVTAKVRNKDGRTDMAKGAVSIGALKGDALANALMKCETKAKRRATLSICGLGWLDESEIEAIPANVKASPPKDVTPQTKARKKPAQIEPPVDPETGEVSPHQVAVPVNGDKPDWMTWGQQMAAALKSAENEADLTAWMEANEAAWQNCEGDAPKIHARLVSIHDERATALSASDGSLPEARPGEPDETILSAG